MESSRSCTINYCKRFSRALCHCCQQNLCIVHLNEHSDSLLNQLTPLADEINTLSEQFNSITSVEPAIFEELEQWRQQAHRLIDQFYERKKQEFDEFVNKSRTIQKKELNALRDQINELSREQDVAHEQINSIKNSLRTLEKLIKLPESHLFTLSPLVIDDNLVRTRNKIPQTGDGFPLPPPYQMFKETGTLVAIAANDNNLMFIQNKNLRLFNRELTVEKEIMWVQGDLQDIIWSNALARFILINSTAIFTLDPKMMTSEPLILDQHRHINTWLCGTCSNHKLFLSTFGKGSSIVEYDLQPPIQFVLEHASPLSCAENESIQDLASNHAALALIISNAVVVLNLECGQVFAREYNLKNFNTNNPDSMFRDAVLRDLCSISKKESLRTHRIPSKLVFDFAPFITENDLLTSSFKPCSHKLVIHYADIYQTSRVLSVCCRIARSITEP